MTALTSDVMLSLEKIPKRCISDNMRSCRRAVSREHQDRYVGHFLMEDLGGSCAIHYRHGVVENHDIRLDVFGQPKRFDPV